MGTTRLLFSTKFYLLFICTVCAGILLLYPVPAIEAVREAMRLCWDTIIPSLFPFLVISSLLTDLLPQRTLRRYLSPLTQPLFRLSGSSAAVLALGFTGGYPVGVRTTTALYKNGSLNRSEAEHLLSFSNNSGPGFLLGVVGIGVFESTAVGLWLYAIHIASALFIGILFGFHRKDAPNCPAPIYCRNISKNFPTMFTEAITGSFLAILNICAFVFFFMIALRMLSFTGILHVLSSSAAFLLAPFGMTEYLATALIAGILELSTGSACLHGIALTPGTAALASFLLGWGGFSVHCQSLTFILETDLSCKSYFIGKLLQAIVSSILAFLLFSILL